MRIAAASSPLRPRPDALACVCPRASRHVSRFGGDAGGDAAGSAAAAARASSRRRSSSDFTSMWVGWLDVPASVVSSASAARAGVRGVAVARRGRRGARFSIARFERVDVCARALRARRRALLTRTRASVRVTVRVEATLRVAASTDGARAATHSRARRTRRTRRASDARSRCREGEPRTARAREDGEG